MMNPVSLANRGLYPEESMPAELLDHKIYFFGSMGMAEAIPAEGKSFHGVLHKMTLEQMTALDKIEVGYDRCDGKVRLYDDTVIDGVTVYCRPGQEKN